MEDNTYISHSPHNMSLSSFQNPARSFMDINDAKSMQDIRKPRSKNSQEELEFLEYYRRDDEN